MLTCRDKMFGDGVELTDIQKEKIEIVERLSESLIWEIKDGSSRVELDYEMSRNVRRTRLDCIPGKEFHTLDWSVEP